jgi:hypothetical protein
MKITLTLLAGFWMTLASANQKASNHEEPAVPVSLEAARQTSIGEDLKITETTLEAARPLMPGKSLAEVVSDDMKIVEDAGNPKRALDFSKINRKKYVKPVFTVKNKRLIGSL